MSMSNLQKDIILNGSESLAVYKDNGVVYRASDIESYTPIVFNNLAAGLSKRFDLKTILDKSYKVVKADYDVVADDDFLNVTENMANNYRYQGASFSIVEQGKRLAWTWVELYSLSTYPTNLILQPNQSVIVRPSMDLRHITLYCQPVYLEQTIVVPEVIFDEPVNSGNENPSPEPVVE